MCLSTYCWREAVNIRERLINNHGVNWATVLRALLTIPVIVFLLGWAYPSMEKAYYRLTPRSTYFNHVSVEPSKKQFAPDESIIMLSVAKFCRDHTIRHADELRCAGKPPLRSHIDTLNGIIPKRNNACSYPYHPVPWKYETWKLPNYRTTCYMVSTPTAVLPYGIEKPQHIVSSEFEINVE